MLPPPGPGGSLKECALPFLQRAELERGAEGGAVLLRPTSGPELPTDSDAKLVKQKPLQGPGECASWPPGDPGH